MYDRAYMRLRRMGAARTTRTPPPRNATAPPRNATPPPRYPPPPRKPPPRRCALASSSARTANMAATANAQTANTSLRRMRPLLYVYSIRRPTVEHHPAAIIPYRCALDHV